MRFFHRFITTLLTLIILVSTAISSNVTKYDIKQTAPLAMLPSNEVRSLYFDKKGLLWIASNTGLSSFDGYKVQTYRSSEFSPLILPNNTTLCIGEDNNNNLWIGTQNGLARMDMRTGKFRQYSLPKEIQRTIYTLLVTSDGTVWIGTDGGLTRYMPSTDSFYTYDNTNTWFKDADGNRYRAINYNVKSIVQDTNGDIIFGTWNSGLFRFNPKSNTFIRYSKINEQNSAHSLFLDHYHRLWIGTWECGLQCMDNPRNIKNPGLHTYKNNGIKNGILDNIIYSIAYESNTNTLWIGNQGGLSVMDLSHPENGFCNYYHGNTEHPLPFNEINSVTTNGEGIVWLGSLTGGVLQTNTRPGLFSNFNFSSFNPFARANTIRSIYTSNGRNFLFGVGAYGVASYDRITGKSIFNNKIPQFSGLTNADLNTTIYSIYKRRNGEIWLGTYGKGIVISKNGAKSRYLRTTNTNFIEDDCILALGESNDGTMLAGQRSSLCVIYNDGHGAILKMKEGGINLSNNEIDAITIDGANRYWLSTSNNGIIRIDGNLKKPSSLKYHRYYIGDGDIKIPDFLNCYKDSRGILWAISNSGGLFRYDAAKDGFITVNKAYHISGDQVRSINEDKWGNIWLGTNYGIVKLTFKNGIETPVIMSFTANDGLNAVTFVPNSTFKYGNEMFFGNFDGLVYFSPVKKFGYRYDKQPRMIISDIKIENTPFNELDSLLRHEISVETPSYTREVNIPSYVNNFGVEFALLTYINPEQCKYSYKLEGYDRDWQYCDATVRAAKYGNLPSGTYTFMLKATDNDGVWYKLPYTITIHVEPPFYATWWAFLIYFLFVITTIYYSTRLYHNHIKTKNRLQMAVVFTNITHELLTPLTVISASVDHLRSLAPQFNNDYTMMQNNIQRLVRLLQQLLETRKSQAGELKLLVSEGDISSFIYKICQSIQPLMTKHDLKFYIECQPEKLDAWFDPDKIDKIIYNLLSNAAKYTGDNGMVKLSLSTDENHKEAFITVSDNGCGISKDRIKHLFERFYDGDYRRFKTIGTGIGLALTRDLVILHKGTIKCDSDEDKGTTFTVTIPIKKETFNIEEIDEKNKIDIDNVKTTIIDMFPNTIPDTQQPEDQAGDEDIYNILLVEDNEELLSLMKQLLHSKYHVYTATNGKGALELVESKDLDIIVTDVMMPVMDGNELTKAIKNNDDYCHLPVIMLTAKSREEDRIEAMQIGVDDFIQKPFKLADLQLRIDNLIENRKRIKKDFRNQFTIEVKNEKLTDPDADFIQRAINCINAHLKDSDYDREQFARDMGASTSTLYNKLRSLTGMNTSGFIRNIRLKTACSIAKQNPKMHVSDLAYRVGFKDPKYFTTCFKKEFGMLLSEYLEKESE